MARLNHKSKLSARTDPTLNRRVRTFLGVLQDEGFRFQSAVGAKRMKVGIEALMSTVILDFLDRPQEDQIEIIRRRLPEYEMMLKGEMRVETLTGPARAAADEKADGLEPRPARPRATKKAPR